MSNRAMLSRIRPRETITRNVISQYVLPSKQRVRSSLVCMSTALHPISPPETSITDLDSLDLANSFRKSHQITVKGCDVSQYHPLMNFQDTPFLENIKSVFLKEKYTSPTAIQAQTWPIILGNKDVISIARTGSGKTIGFVLPAIHRVLVKRKEGALESCIYEYVSC